MATKAGVGFSDNIDPKIAGQEAYHAATSEIERPNFLLLFASPDKDQRNIIAGIREVAPGIPLIGCSDSGEITNYGERKNGVVLLAIRSDSISFHTGAGSIISEGPRNAGLNLARNIKSQSYELKCVITLLDVLAGNGSEIIRGMQDELGQDFLIVGGAAGDNFQFKETYVYKDDVVIPSSIVGVGLSGNFSVGIGVRHGWTPIGLPMKVTRSNGAVIEELDGKPAISIYEEYFGKKAEELKQEPLAKMAITYPLGLKVEGSDEMLIRDPLSVDEKGAITCAAEIPLNCEIHLMIGSKNEAIAAASDAAKRAMSELKNKASFIIIFNCIARNKLFGKDASSEIEAIKSVVGHDVPIIGFYTYGEIAPIKSSGKGGVSCFHNETIVILAIGD